MIIIVKYGVYKNRSHICIKRGVAMLIEDGKFYFIKDEFFEVFKCYGLMVNKENGNKRPCYFCFRDRKNKDIIWFVPISTKYEKYKKLIDDAVFYNETLNIQKTSKSLHLFNMLFRIIVVVLIFMIIVAFFNLIFDNRKNNQLLKFLGYSKSNIFLVMMCNFFSMIVISLIIYILGWMLL